MVKERVGSLAWLRKRSEQADADLLREMVKTMAEYPQAPQGELLPGMAAGTAPSFGTSVGPSGEPSATYGVYRHAVSMDWCVR